MDKAYVNVIRGDIVESRHAVTVAVANSAGRLLAYAGEPDTVTYMRSAAKPLQAMNVILSGAADRFGFTDKELAVMCGSHYGEDFHREAVLSILNKIGMRASDLRCPAQYSISSAYRRKQLYERLPIDETNSDCSGKHAGFLAVCRMKGYSTVDYDSKLHPMQREVLDIIAGMCSVDRSDIITGVDGCGVPVHALSVKAMAAGFARLANPAGLDDDYALNSGRIFAAMNSAPEMVAGTGGFCTELMKNTRGKLCAKLGAEGVYCVGLKNRNIGIAIKIEDGGSRALHAAVMRVLSELGALNAGELKALESFCEEPNINRHGVRVGSVKADFGLRFV